MSHYWLCPQGLRRVRAAAQEIIQGANGIQMHANSCAHTQIRLQLSQQLFANAGYHLNHYSALVTTACWSVWFSMRASRAQLESTLEQSELLLHGAWVSQGWLQDGILIHQWKGIFRSHQGLWAAGGTKEISLADELLPSQFSTGSHPLLTLLATSNVPVPVLLLLTPNLGYSSQISPQPHGIFIAMPLRRTTQIKGRSPGKLRASD